MPLTYLKIPFINLLIAVLFGAFLRYLHMESVPGVNFKYLVHAHSHVAFLGWVYLFFFIAIVKLFLPHTISLKKYKLQFWLSQVSVLGMLFSFPVTGYAAISITFSTIHILLSWWFIYSVTIDLKDSIASPDKVSKKFLKAGLFFLFISSFGPFALGALMAKGLGGTDWYDISIYYYLHFQYNGWFSFAFFACVIKLIENKFLDNYSPGPGLFYALFISCILTFALSVLFVKPPLWIYLIGLAGAVIQLYFLILWKKVLPAFDGLVKSGITRLVFKTVLASLSLKFIFQFFSVFIDVLHIRYFVIGYLHLFLLGFITLGILLIMLFKQWIRPSGGFSAGVILFIFSFVGSELFIFLQGASLFFNTSLNISYPLVIFIFSLLMVIGVFTFAIKVISHKK